MNFDKIYLCKTLSIRSICYNLLENVVTWKVSLLVMDPLKGLTLGLLTTLSGVKFLVETQGLNKIPQLLLSTVFSFASGVV